jgi:uncharacterized membrane-anchored protein YitT (DUF2179 family)
MSETGISSQTVTSSQTGTSSQTVTPSSTIAAIPAANTNAPAVLYCANHPDTETLLRCNRCNKPICLKCAVLTDVGYRCKECIRGVQASYFNAIPTDNLVGFGVALIVTAIAAPIAGFLFGFVPFFIGLILAFAIGSGAGGALAQIIRRSIGYRRGRYLRYFTLAGIILGVLIGSAIGLLFFGINPLNLSTLAFTILSSATAYQILR